MPDINPPSFSKRLKESRALLDISTAGLFLLKDRLFSDPKLRAKESASPIILFPGFATNDSSLWPLRQFLTRLGYQAEGWGLGPNYAGTDIRHTLDDVNPRWNMSLSNVGAPATYNGEGGVPLLCDRAIDRVLERSAAFDAPITLVGWSLGGFLAREVARELPNQVDRLITFGAPVIGGPKYTAAAKVFKARGLDVDWIELEIEKRNAKPISQPITAIYSKSDGVVAWQASIDDASPNIEHIEVDVSHLGMGFNRQVWRHIANALAQ